VWVARIRVSRVHPRLLLPVFAVSGEAQGCGTFWAAQAALGLQPWAACAAGACGIPARPEARTSCWHCTSVWNATASEDETVWVAESLGRQCW